MDKKIIAWAQGRFSSLGYFLKPHPWKVIKDTPWSLVLQGDTSKGSVYVKKTPQLLGLEPMILNRLKTHFHVSVPTVLAYNERLSCFLMEDAGLSLRAVL